MHSMSQNTETNTKFVTKIYGKTGLTNNANSCYMNSAIQALSHNYPLTSYLFRDKENIYLTILKNARKILLNHPSFKLETDSMINLELKQKINNPEYRPSDLTTDEKNIILNHTMTVQIIKLLENMWTKNCVIAPTSFRKIFCNARDKFFMGNEQHDSEEAYSCIIQQMQEELSESRNIKFDIKDPSLLEFINFKNEIRKKIESNLLSEEEKKILFNDYLQMKKLMNRESIITKALCEMKKNYDTSFCKITEIFMGFLHSSISCPNSNCNFSSDKFDPFFHLALPLPPSLSIGRSIEIESCMKEYCKQEILDEQNLWLCEGCNSKVRGIKKLQLWTTPPVLVIQLKRFGIDRIHKDNRLVTFPLENFNVDFMMSPQSTEFNVCTKYRLQCVINHVGGMGGGHYYTYCMDEDSAEWFKFDDKRVTRINSNSIVTRSAYILFYIREDLYNSITKIEKQFV